MDYKITHHKLNPVSIKGTEDEIVSEIKELLENLRKTAPKGEIEINCIFYPMCIVSENVS